MMKKEKFKMEKTLKIEGMMCPHCEARVKKILEALAEVDMGTDTIMSRHTFRSRFMRGGRD